MATKTYKANSIREAIGQIKEELGAEAMILSTKKVPKGPQNPYGRDTFEITAAGKEELSKDDKMGADMSFSSLAPWNEQPAMLHRGKADDSREWTSLQNELSQIKNMLLLSNQSAGFSDLLHLPSSCLNLYAKLLRCGISERRVWSLIRESGAFDQSKDVIPEQILQKVMKALLASIHTCEPFAMSRKGPLVAAFVGPTGVGKTTTIAKLSAELSLKQKKNVGIISIDSYRIGAVEQLKTYAAIMGLPCLPAFSKEDLTKALQKMKQQDVILIDTAGQSHRDMDRLKELAELLPVELSIDTHLVLSATTKPEDMKDAANNFSILHPKSYVFTKLDETQTCGGMIDQVMDLSLPISYITNGQRVPEDIMVATQKRILNMIFGKK
jgi:flagellar biosynthesis protein FlhF